MDRIAVGLLTFVMWSVFMDLASTTIINGPVNTEVMVGHSTYLNCSTSDPSKEIHWYHYPIGAQNKDHEYVYAHGRMHPPFDKRFRIDKDNSPGSFDLVLTDVEFRDAGLYVCQNGGGTGQLISAQLVVLDTLPSCETNIKPEGFVGPNSCDIETDKVQLSCGVNYHGNIHPVLEWTRVGQKTRASSSEPVCDVSDTRIACNVTLDTDINMDGSTFVCQTTRAVQEQYRCTTDKAKVLYAVSEETPQEKTIGDDVTCSAKTNSPSCRYNWIWFDGVTKKAISNDHNLKVTEQGWHRCEANCNIKENPCTIIPMLVKGSAAPVPATRNESKLDVVIAVVATFVFCLILALIPGYFMWRKLKGETQELRSSVEELRDKDSQWKEEKRKIQAQLGQVEELTATILEVQAHETAEYKMKSSVEQLQTVIAKLLRDIPELPVYRYESLRSKYDFNGCLATILEMQAHETDECKRKSSIEQLQTVIAKLLRDIQELPVYREESLRSKYDFNGCLGFISNGKQRKEKDIPSVKNDEQSDTPLIIGSIAAKKLRKEMPSMEKNQEDNSSSFSNNNELGGEVRKTDDLCETHNASFIKHDSLVSKLKGFGRIGQ